MQKRFIEKLDAKLSPLGMGVMRLPMEGNEFKPEAYKLMRLAMESGINYFDTAFPYLKSRSEELIRETIVINYPRESFYIADKLPVWDCRTENDLERIFNIQLERLGVSYIDFYLLHGLHRARWLDIERLNVLAFLDRKKKEGKIKKAGFSMHDNTETLKLITNAYSWDFAQLQINYYDWTMQHAKESYEYLEEKDIPCIVMEPVGGGRLCNLPLEAEEELKSIRPENSLASWAIRFSASLPNVAVTLSGMGNRMQLEDNLSSFEPFKTLNDNEYNAINHVVEIINSYSTIPCTACGYCLEDCPKGIEIPYIFQLFNDCEIFKAKRLNVEYFTFVPVDKQASMCISCGKCIKKCPQGIVIPTELKKVQQEVEALALGFKIQALKDNKYPLVLFGSGQNGRQALQLIQKNGYSVLYFCDNNLQLKGQTIEGIPVISAEDLIALSAENELSVLITTAYYKEIKEQLVGFPIMLLN